MFLKIFKVHGFSFVIISVLAIATSPKLALCQDSIPDTIRTSKDTIIGIAGAPNQIESPQLLSEKDGQTSELLFPPDQYNWYLLLNDGSVLEKVLIERISWDSLYVRGDILHSIYIEEIAEMRKNSHPSPWSLTPMVYQDKVPNWTIIGLFSGVAVGYVTSSPSDFGGHQFGMLGGGIVGGLSGLLVHIVAAVNSSDRLVPVESSPEEHIYLFYSLSKQNKYNQIYQLKLEEDRLKIRQKEEGG